MTQPDLQSGLRADVPAGRAAMAQISPDSASMPAGPKLAFWTLTWLAGAALIAVTVLLAMLLVAGLQHLFA